MELKTFDDLINLGQVRRTVDLAGHAIVMHTLAGNEYAKLSERLGEVTDKVKFEALQRQIIASSIDSIDGHTLQHEEKVELLGKMQLGLQNMLYSVYTDMVAEQEKLLDEAKKKSSPTLS